MHVLPLQREKVEVEAGEELTLHLLLLQREKVEGEEGEVVTDAF